MLKIEKRPIPKKPTDSEAASDQMADPEKKTEKRTDKSLCPFVSPLVVSRSARRRRSSSGRAIGFGTRDMMAQEGTPIRHRPVFRATDSGRFPTSS